MARISGTTSALKKSCHLLGSGGMVAADFSQAQCAIVCARKTHVSKNMKVSTRHSSVALSQTKLVKLPSRCSCFCGEFLPSGISPPRKTSPFLKCFAGKKLQFWHSSPRFYERRCPPSHVNICILRLSPSGFSAFSLQRFVVIGRQSLSLFRAGHLPSRRANPYVCEARRSATRSAAKKLVTVANKEKNSVLHLRVLRPTGDFAIAE